jgi:hypothetical protein
MEAAKQEIEQTGGVGCLGRQSESRDRGEHKRGTAFQWFTATQRHGNTPRLNRFQTTIQLDNRAGGRFVPRIPPIPEKLRHPVENRPPSPRSVAAMAKKA